MGNVDMLMAGAAAKVLLVSLLLLRTHPPSLLVCCFLFSWRREHPKAGGKPIVV
jgi:hypothetical protein